MTDRRNFLKLFGIGSSIIPIVKGLPSGDPVEIVKPPQVVIPETKIVTVPNVSMIEKYALVMFARNQKTGSTFKMECDAFLTDLLVNIPGMYTMNFRVTGKIVQRVI